VTSHRKTEGAVERKILQRLARIPAIYAQREFVQEDDVWDELR